MELGLADISLRLLLGVVIGFCIGLTGVGGGVLVLPGLTLILALPASVAVGTASLYAFLTKILATYHHVRLKTIDWRTSASLLAGAIPGTALTALWINRLLENAQMDPSALTHLQQNLKTFIAIVIVVSAVMLVINMVTRRKKNTEAEQTLLARKLADHPYARGALGTLVGLIVGILIGATSIGGGILMVPLLIIVFGLSSSRTVGSSIFIAVVLTFIVSLIYGKGNQIDLITAMIMAGGSLISVRMGSRLSVRMPEKLLQGVIVVVVFASGILMMLKRGH